MSVPSVKGTLFRAVVEELKGLLSEGVIQREELAARCKLDDLSYLDREIAIASWYPIDTYGRYLRFLCDRFGGGRPEYLIEGGRKSAQRVIEMGVYGQLDDRTRFWEAKVGRLLVTLGGAFYNFGRWSWEGSKEKGIYIEVEEVSAMPEEAAQRARGFVEHLTSRAAGRPVKLEYQRPRPSLIVFRARRLHGRSAPRRPSLD